MMKDTTVLDELIIGRVEPHIYAFTTNTIPNYLKVGDTYRPISRRLSEWREYFPNLEMKFQGSAKITDRVYFRDFSVHRFLEFERSRARLLDIDIPEGVYYSREFFKEATIGDVEDAISDIKEDYYGNTGKYQYYDAITQLPTTGKYASTGEWKIRPNQQATIEAFKKAVANGRTHLLMYAVMRFGKSFTSMCCAKEMGANLVVVVSAKADVRDEWRKTVESAENFRNDYEFFSSADLKNNYSVITDTLDHPENPKKVVVFLTLQDLQGEQIKEKHAEIFGRKIDLLLVDETHFGARAEKYGAVLRTSQGEKLSAEERGTVEDVLEHTKAFDAKITIHLSGTPYRILMGDEFDKEKDLIAFYQFTDIVHDQEKWDRENLSNDEPKEEWENPYFGFPQMIRFAFNPNESARKKLEALRASGMSDAFSALLAPKSIKKAEDGSHRLFVHEQEVLDLLEVIDGSKEDEQLLGFLDYSKIKEGNMCRHMVIVLPYCASCDALEALIKNNITKFKNLNDYEIINISGVDASTQYKTPSDVTTAISRFEAGGKKTITLTVNRMLTGSTVPEWDTMLFLKDTASPQEYDQAIFRLQNQYIRIFTNENGETIRFNMKPQTLLVDFDPRRVFFMQEQKAQIYNVNTDEAGNTKLRQRMEEELRISPIIVMNKDRMSQITATDILEAVSEYSKNRGVAEETAEIPVDISLMDIAVIRAVIERENELGSKAGFTIKGAEGEGTDMDTPDNAEQTEASIREDKPKEATPPSAIPVHEKPKDFVKQFRSYYARILFFAFLTKNNVISLSDIIQCIDETDNARIARNLVIQKGVLESILVHANKFVLSKLDYKIQNMSRLSHDETVDAITRASVAIQKFGKLGESEVITPRHICKDMVGMIADTDLRKVIDNGGKVLDIAGKAGEFALATYERCLALGYTVDVLKNAIYTIPTSGITYEFTRRAYEILGLNIQNIATKFTSYSLLEVKDVNGNINCEKIAMLLRQNKPFSSIVMNDEIMERDDNVRFDIVIGNPPYHFGDGSGGSSDSAMPIYNHFISLSKKICSRFLSTIVPSKWMVGGRGLNKFRDEMINDTSIKMIVDYENASDCFDGMHIDGGVCYFLWDTEHNGETFFRYITQSGERVETKRFLKNPFFDYVVRDSRILSILRKCSMGVSFNTIVSNVKPFGVRGYLFNEPERYPESNLCMVPFDNCVRIFGVKGIKGGARRVEGYVRREFVSNNAEVIDKYKLFFTTSYSTSAVNPPKVILAKPGDVCTETFLLIGNFDTEDEQLNCLSYIETKFFRFLLYYGKGTMHVNKNVFSLIPLQDFSKSWTDEELYVKYNLTEEEIIFIESMFKSME